MPRFASSLCSVALVTLLPFLLRCGGDDSKNEDASDAGSDGSTSSGADGSTGPGEDGGPTSSDSGSGPQPAWANAPLKSPGCGMPATPSGTNGDAKTVMVGGGPRTFLVYVPKGYDPNKNYPVVLSYHGIDAQGADMAQFLQFQTYSMGDAIAVFPDGEQTSPGHYVWDTSGDKDLLFFDAMLKSLEDTLCINERRVFVLGFSLGAYMVNHLGCKRSDVIRAFIPADGGFPDSPASCGKTTVLVYHRTEDDNEAVANGRRARDNWLGIDGCKSASTSMTGFGFNDMTAGDMGCLQYDGCPANTTVSYCEDMYVSPQGYKHDLRQPYRVPMWNWFNHF